jgi:hypothetical protein
VVVQRKIPAVLVDAHFESTPGAKPQAPSLAVLVLEVQSLERYSFKAVQVLVTSEQMSAVSPSMLTAFFTTPE